MSQMPVSNIIGQNPGQQNLLTTANQTTTTFGPFSHVSEIEKCKYRQQLVLLLHAYKCQKRDSSNGEVRGECNLGQCQGMRNVLSHIQICRAGNACTVQNCVSSRALILHWKNCTQKECALCLPLKQAPLCRQQQQQQQPVVQTSQAPNSAVVQRSYTSLGLPFSASNSGVIESAMQNLSLSSSLENEQTSQSPSQIVNHIQLPQTSQQQANVVDSGAIFMSQIAVPNIVGQNPGQQSLPGNVNIISSRTKLCSRKLTVQRCVQSLVHSCHCRDPNCKMPNCLNMKKVLTHTKQCKRKTIKGCAICKQFIALCYHHARACQETKCPVLFCLNFKHKLKLQQGRKMAHILKRSIATMTDLGVPSTVSQTSGGNSYLINQPSSDPSQSVMDINPLFTTLSIT